MTLRTLEQILGPAQFVDLDADAEPRSRPLTERGGDVYLVPHHSVSRTLQAILAEFFSPNRTLSATAAVGPTTAGVDAYESRHTVPWNTHRPYTTSSWIDDQAITFEMANLVLAPPWPVGQTGKNWVAELIAAMHVELGMPIDEWHVVDHNTVYQRGWGSYPTTCCGEDLRAALAWCRAEAIRLVATGGAVNPLHVKESLMNVYANVETNRWFTASEVDGSFLPLTNGAPQSASLKAARQGDQPIRINNAEEAWLRAWYAARRLTDARVYANATTNGWWLLGPGVVYPIKAGEQAIFEQMFGPRVVISDADMDILKRAFTPAIAGGGDGPGDGEPVDLQPVLDAIAAVPGAVQTQLTDEFAAIPAAVVAEIAS